MGLAAMAVKNIADVMRFAWAAVAIRYQLVLLDVAFVPLASVSLIPRITGARIAPPRAVLEGIKGASSSSVTQAAYPSPVGVLPKKCETQQRDSISELCANNRARNKNGRNYKPCR